MGKHTWGYLVAVGLGAVAAGVMSYQAIEGIGPFKSDGTSHSSSAVYKNVEQKEEQILFLYEDYPPFFILGERGQMTGVYGARAQRAINEAGLTVRWQQVSFNRLFRIIEGGMRRACAAGYRYSSSRAKKVTFSQPFALSPPTVFVAGRDAAAKMRALGSFSRITGSKDFKGVFLNLPVFKRYFSDSESAEKQHLFVNVEDRSLFEMVLSGRADYTPLNIETAAYLIRETGAADDVHIVDLEGMPKGGIRYILCSDAVSKQEMDRINKALPSVSKADIAVP